MTTSESNYQRHLLLGISILLLAFGGLREALGSNPANVFFNMAVLRVGLVLFAIWLAYPLLKRPAAWLPPGAAALGLILLGAVVASPKLLPVLLPVFGLVLTFAGVVKFFRGKFK